MTNSLTICSTSIRTDYEGRYCLNDLHAASGGEDKTKPSNFFRPDSTSALIDELLTSEHLKVAIAPLRAVAGRTGGTWVVKELVYAYAMWISPKFHLQVIRAYDALVTAAPAQEPTLKAPGTLREALLLALAQALCWEDDEP
jgi:hypothetical protein